MVFFFGFPSLSFLLVYSEHDGDDDERMKVVVNQVGCRQMRLNKSGQARLGEVRVR